MARLRGGHPRYLTHTLKVVVLYFAAGFVQARGPAYRAACGLHNLTSEKRSLPAAQQISNLQGVPSGIEHLRKGFGPAMDRGSDPLSGGSGVLVPWTLDACQTNPEPIEGEGCPLVPVSESPTSSLSTLPAHPFHSLFPLPLVALHSCCDMYRERGMQHLCLGDC